MQCGAVQRVNISYTCVVGFMCGGRCARCCFISVRRNVSGAKIRMLVAASFPGPMDVRVF